jgi:hypothetical protein
MVSINVTVKNEGDYPEVANVTIHYFTTYIDSENLTLAIGENDTALFNWDTSGLTPGYYTVKATATIDEDDDLFDNYDQKVVTLTVHDVNVTSIEAPQHAPNGTMVSITVTVKNEGFFIEEANLTLKYDGTLIGNETVSLVTGQSLNVTFTWNTTGVSYGNYTLTAAADVLVSAQNPTGVDDDPADNTLVDGTVLVTIPGDVNGDKTVNGLDLDALVEAYGSTSTSPNWNPDADINGDGVVDIFDIGICSSHWGQSW